ncbi:MAG TPA: PDR/VanB family oxidoreductase [Nocardioides sp.]|uniref:PDR/VanB family oxidoreductase n=1 Tax=Nocardioides sp. TaxID=35761 RepID=UPI002C210B8B|nr:PDR/VanB family oxidoreductase [Nocardioides sp.]HQR26102.1 PDR/VanB family oxidoreductase [Nocardioides sp.]
MSQPTPTVVTEFEADVVVTGLTHPAEDVVELTLSAPDGRALPPWTPGAHIDLLLDSDLVRQYSLCSSPAEPTSYRVAVLRAPDGRGGSERVHALSEGARVRIRGPRNNFPLLASPRYLFIAGGIGITPMLPMIEEAQAAGADWHLHYGGRSRASMAYLADLEKYADRVTVVPQDEQGLLDVAGILGTPQPGTLIYCCGPEPLLAVVEEHSSQWPAGALHLERFAAKTVEREGEDASFELVLQRSGITVTVPPDKSVFDTMRDAGVSVLGSCLEGICGTCETGVLEGEVDHRDSVLDPDEQEAMDCMMVCVSRCQGDRLVLDA